MPEYVTVYNISEQYPDWPLACACSVPLAVAIVVMIGKSRFRWHRPSWLFTICLAIFGAAMAWLVGSVAFGKNLEGLKAFRLGYPSAVEGIVTNFHPMPYEGHEDECFSVHLHRFCYSDYVAVPGFRNTASHGGPIRPGIDVRVTYLGAAILRLEIAKADMPTSAQSQAAAKLAQSQWKTRMQDDPVQQRMMTASLLAAVCWTLWWNVQWKRIMRLWLRPPYRRSTEYFFRIFFGLNLARCFSRSSSCIDTR